MFLSDLSPYLANSDSLALNQLDLHQMILILVDTMRNWAENGGHGTQNESECDEMMSMIRERREVTSL